MSKESNTAVRQLADWLLTDPQTGEILHFAGPLERDFLGLSRVKMQSAIGDVWTLTAGLREGYLTASERMANLRAALAEEGNAAPEPIDMLLFCPKCGVQHVDAPEEQQMVDRLDESKGMREWTNPPHRSHLCHACGTIWRPADVPTNGVAVIQTRGKADTWDGKPEPRAEVMDIARLNWLRDESCDLRCIDIPTGAGDSEVRWVVVQHHMSKPHEREIGRSHSEDPREAIDAARTGGDHANG